MTSFKGKDDHSHNQPPRWATRFLKWYCSEDLLEEVAGDIHEVFLARVEELGIRKARHLYIWDVFKFFNYSTIRGRKKTSFQLINIEMIRNYFKIAIRSLLHQKESSFINIFGLGLGLTIIIFILLYTRHENSFDRFHSNFDKIYRVIEKQQTPEGGSVIIGSAAPPIGREIVTRYPDAIRSTSVANFGQSVVTIIDSSAATNPRIYNERDYIIADENFFQIFDFNFISGDKINSLLKPKEVVLTKRAALKYFGANDVIGKTLINNRTGELKVSGLVDNPPKNSHLDFDFIISLATFKQSERGQRYFNSWDQNGVSQYILTDQPVEARLWDSRMSEIASDFLSENNNNRSFQIQSLADIHYGSNEINYELNSIEESKTNETYLKIFMWIGIVILLIASINYINLATARSLRRSREIGVRKVVGATRKQLIGQFMAESLLTSFISGIIALVLSLVLLPYFNNIAETEFIFQDLLKPVNLAYLGIVVILVGFVAGLFPSLILSSIKIANTIRGVLSTKYGNTTMRKVLVAFQFMATLTIIASTIIVYRQLKYIQTKDLGFDQEHLIVVDINSGTARNNFQRFKNEFIQHPSIEEVAVSSRVPGEWKNIDQIAIKPRRSNQVDSSLAYFFAFDEDVIPTLELNLLEGRNFSGNAASDSTAIILNESAAAALGLQEPLGSQITIDEVPYPMEVVGLVKDFNVESLHKTISPVVIGFRQNPVTSIDYFICRINGDDIPQTLAYMEEVQTRLDPETPLEYHFLDQQIERFYREDVRVSRIFLTAAILTLFIACMGLFGLITFTIGQRLKEVGIRKILGATENQLWILLSRDIIILIIIAFIIAIPVSWFFMRKWLDDFAFSISINVFTYLTAVLVVLMIALTTVHLQLRKAIKTNPANTLHN